MLLHNCSFSNAFASPLSNQASNYPGKPQNLVSHQPLSSKKQKPFIPTYLKAQLSDEILQLSHNQVLIAAGVSAAIGQLAKPFTSVLLYGKDFDIKTVVQAGGFPSTHSSAVVATATCLGLERGLSDSIFGLTVVYAGLIMYDAQGVRREVGIHARTLNKILHSKPGVNSFPAKGKDSVDSQPGTSLPVNTKSLGAKVANSLTSKSVNASMNSQSNGGLRQITQVQSTSSLVVDVEEGPETNKPPPLKESIGHTEVEVVAGALLGFLVSLAVHALL